MSQRNVPIKTLNLAFDCLRDLVNRRMESYLNQRPTGFLYEKGTLQAIKDKLDLPRLFSHSLSDDELIILLLALVPHFVPDFFTRLMEEHLPQGGDLPIFGGYRGSNHRGILPTGETALFVLGGQQLDNRLKIQQLLQADGPLAQQQIAWVEPLPAAEPGMSGPLVASTDLIELLTYGRVSRPRFSAQFGAEYLTTDLEWEDLILNSFTMTQLDDLLIWLTHQSALLNDWEMRKKLKPGYRVLFYGPPGTGKTLSASLLGKKTGRDVYRVDLAKVVSKYIGETEKNLDAVFTRARNKNWILFFDEADSLFGKRTTVRDAHDKYANQEVSYLLQAIEQYNGLVILATNMKGNLDEAFYRRFQAVVYFSTPSVAERFRLWENAFPPAITLAPDVVLARLAEQYELSGASIINVVQYACLQALHHRSSVIRADYILAGIKRENWKEGKIAGL